MKNSTRLLIFFLLLGCNAKNNSKEHTNSDPRFHKLLGFYEYQAPRGGSNLYILIDTLKGKYYGIYYRAETRRGKGQEYFANSLTNFQFSGDTISFVLDDRKLFNSKPVAPGKLSGNIPVPLGVIGTGALKFNGTVASYLLKLQCTSADGNCPESLMEFRKIPLPE